MQQPVNADQTGQDAEAEAEDWQRLCYAALWELWDNEEDAVYDTL